MIVNKIFQKINLQKIFYIFLGLLMILTYFWFPFIRNQLPKDIPIQLSFLGLVILNFICSFYLYSLLQTLKKNIKNRENNFHSLFDFFFLPLKELDLEIKKRFNLEKFFINNSQILQGKRIKIFLLSFSLLPKIIICLVLLIETFYFHHLSFFYQIILLGIFILFEKYLIYTIKKIKDDLFEKMQKMEKILYFLMELKYFLEIKTIFHGILPEYYDEEEGDYLVAKKMPIPVTEFFIYQELKFIEKGRFKPFTITTTLEGINLFCKENNIEAKDTTLMEYFKVKENNVKFLLNFIEFSINYQKMIRNPLVKKIKILVIMGMLISCLYILVVSLPNLYFDPFFDSLLAIMGKQNPFD